MMRKLPLSLAGIVLTIFLSPPLYAQSTSKVTLTTYYPAPSGAYDRLRLVPRATIGGSSCQIGTLYYDTSTKAIRSCVDDGVDGEWTLMPSAWKQTSDRITLSDLSLTSPKVGIGTQSPEVMFQIDNIDGIILAKGSAGSGSALPASAQGVGTRLLWFPKQGALRAGTTGVNSYSGNDGTEWNESNIGLNTVAFGWSNVAKGSESAVTGGFSNEATGGRTFIGGGTNNVAKAMGSTIAGGSQNTAGTDLPSGSGPGYSNPVNMLQFVGGGVSNVALGGWTVVVGGSGNETTAVNHAVIVGGAENRAEAARTFVGGGQENKATGHMSTVVNGWGNTASGEGSFVGGGGAVNGTSFTFYDNGNVASGSYATIAGGERNGASGDHTFIGSGGGNAASGSYATVGGGSSNSPSGSYATIAGGAANTTNVAGTPPTAGGNYAAIGGGASNRASGTYAVVGGGQANLATGTHAVVSGGGPIIIPGLPATTIRNTASGNYSTVSGGQANSATANHAAVVGGYKNGAAGISATVLGGSENMANGDHSLSGGKFMQLSGAADNTFVWGYADAATTVDAPDSFIVYNTNVPGNARVGLGVLNPTQPLELAGGAYSDGVSWQPASSRELKKDIAPVSSKEAIDTVKQLEPVSFKYKNIAGDHIRHGFIAEDVPETVASAGRKSIDPMNFIAVLTKVVQEQQKQIEEQKSLLEAQQKRSLEQQREIDALKARLNGI